MRDSEPRPLGLGDWQVLVDGMCWPPGFLVVGRTCTSALTCDLILDVREGRRGDTFRGGSGGGRLEPFQRMDALLRGIIAYDEVIRVLAEEKHRH